MYSLIKLDNGLRVALESIEHVNSVSVGVWIENGSRNENKFNNGMSHFIEHMMFKGTTNRTSLEIAESIEDVGGQINAFTGKEATCYYIKVLDSHLELSLDVLSDMIFNSKFSQDDMEKEKGVVIEEINMSEDSPEDVLSDLQSLSIWGEDSISLPILGSIDTVKSFTREKLLEYVTSYYIPENSVISIAGKFDMNTIGKLVEKYFGNWSSNIKKITKYSSPAILNNNLHRKKNIEQLHIGLGIPGVPAGHDDTYSLLLLCNMFGGGASSVLFQKIREEKGLCYSIYSYSSAFQNTGVVSIYTGLNPAYAHEALNLICSELEAFSTNELSKEKVEKSKEQLKGSYVLGLESTSSRMFSNGKSALFLNRINKPSDVIQKINNITMDRLHDVMKRTFAMGIMNSAFVGPGVDVDGMKNIVKHDSVAFRNPGKSQV